jgi:hypothetical protein
MVLFPDILKVDFVQYLCAADAGEGELVSDLLLCWICFMIRSKMGLCISVHVLFIVIFLH